MRNKSRTNLKKTISPSWAWAMAFGSSIGWGAFILPSDWVGQAGSVGAMIGMGLGAMIMMMIATCYGILIRLFPVAGGGYTYAYISAGRHWAFVTGWFMVLGYASIVALNASAFTLLLKYLFPSAMEKGYLYTIAGWEVFIPEVLIASGMILLFAHFNVKGTSISGKLQFLFSIILGLCVLFMGGYTFLYAEEPIRNMQPFFIEEQSILISILTILAIAPWAFVGFDNVPQSAEEFKFSTRKVTKLIILSLVASGLVYILMIGVASWTFEATNYKGDGSLWEIGSIIQSSLGKVGVSILAIAIMMGIFTGLNGFISSSSRLLYSMARGKALPHFYTDLHPKYGTPYKAIWFISIVMVPATWFGRPALSWIVDMSSIGVTAGYLFTCITAYRYLSWKKEQSHQYAPFKKMIALLGVFASIMFILLLLLPFSPAVLQTPSFIALIAWIILGLIFYAKIYKTYSSVPEADLRYYILNKSK